MDEAIKVYIPVVDDIGQIALCNAFISLLEKYHANHESNYGEMNKLKGKK